MRSTFKILFYLNTSKRKKSGCCPVIGRITVDGGVSQFSLKEDAHPDHWDAKMGRATGKSREQVALNKKIVQTEQTIRKIYARTVETSGYVTAEQIKNELTGTTSKAENLLELFREHNLEFEKRVGIDRNKITYNKFANSYKHLSRFIQTKFGMEDYPLKQLDLSFIDSYDLYLRADAGLSVNSMVKDIFFLKKMVTRAINQGTLVRNPFLEYVASKTKWKYQNISGEELERIMTTKISHRVVGFIRDMFVFSCFTGLAYADMCTLCEKHLHRMPDGSIWIKIQRYKTDVECNIPLLDIPLTIIEKYRPARDGEQLFKIPSNGAVSNNLRSIEKMCNISHLHFHMARHTFATLICISNGVSIEAISKMMGHLSIRTTQIYAEITSQKVGEDMKKLAQRLKTKEKHKISDN